MAWTPYDVDMTPTRYASLKTQYTILAQKNMQLQAENKDFRESLKNIKQSIEICKSRRTDDNPEIESLVLLRSKQHQQFKHVFNFLIKKRLDSQAFEQLDIPTLDLLRKRKIVRKIQPYGPVNQDVVISADGDVIPTKYKPMKKKYDREVQKNVELEEENKALKRKINECREKIVEIESGKLDQLILEQRIAFQQTNIAKLSQELKSVFDFLIKRKIDRKELQQLQDICEKELL